MKNFINPTELELQEETVVCINRVSKATTGGRAMRFNSLVVVGDGKGHVGLGFGKANEVASAVNKARENAKKSIFKVNLINGTIPHANILSKNTGSTNAINVAKAVAYGLKQLRDPLTVARQRGITLRELFT